MRKIVAGFAVSLDGFMEGPMGEYDWIIIDPDIDFSEQVKRFDTFLMGRKSYEKLLPMGAGAFPGIRSYVYSNTLHDVAEGYSLIRENASTQLRELKTQPGKDMALYGGADLLTSLLSEGFVDELVLTVVPVLLGAGKRFLGTLPSRVSLSLLEAKQRASGTMQLSYQINQ